ncbi:MAG: aspartate/glutamate racemase family protein [Anaerolineae bacterium]|nr:aspartate/glutamate racemase family protein [Anaerolineae bacterium]
MVSKILYIDPVGIELVQEGLQVLLDVKQPATEVKMVSLPRGPHHLEYRYYEALVLTDILQLVREAERQAFDAAVIGCFYDVGLQQAREVAERMAVVAPCEAATRIAATLGDKFSIIVGRRKWIPEMMENVVRYGMKDRLASFKSVELGVLDFHRDQAETARRLRQAGREAIEQDGAEVLILGCTATYGFYRELQAELGVPVLDPMVAAFKTAEFAADLVTRLSWSHSKIAAYESPPPAELEAWRLDEQYGHPDMAAWLRQRAKPA